MERLFELLQKIRETPQLFIGKPSLERLASFIYGYACNENEIDNKINNLFFKFQGYIEKYYDIQSTQNWAKIIDFFCSTKEEAFYRFYEHLDEFLKENDET